MQYILSPLLLFWDSLISLKAYYKTSLENFLKVHAHWIHMNNFIMLLEYCKIIPVNFWNIISFWKIALLVAFLFLHTPLACVSLLILLLTLSSVYFTYVDIKLADLKFYTLSFVDSLQIISLRISKIIVFVPILQKCCCNSHYGAVPVHRKVLNHRDLKNKLYIWISLTAASSQYAQFVSLLPHSANHPRLLLSCISFLGDYSWYSSTEQMQTFLWHTAQRHIAQHGLRSVLSKHQLLPKLKNLGTA